MANLSVTQDAIRLLRQIGTGAQPRLAGGAKLCEPEHVQCKVEHQSSKQYALHIWMEFIVSCVRVVLLKALWTWRVNLKVCDSDSLQSTPLHPACWWSVAGLPVSEHYSGLRSIKICSSSVHTRQGFFVSSPERAFSPIAQLSKQTSCKLYLYNNCLTVFHRQ